MITDESGGERSEYDDYNGSGDLNQESYLTKPAQTDADQLSPDDDADDQFESSVSSYDDYEEEEEEKITTKSTAIAPTAQHTTTTTTRPAAAAPANVADTFDDEDLFVEASGEEGSGIELGQVFTCTRTI